MSIISGYRKLKNYILETEGYKLISRWTSAHTVEFDNGQTAVEKISDMELDIAGRIPSSQKGTASGVATLGQDGKIPVDQIPKVAMDTLVTVPDNEARFALTIQDCQKGDTVKVLNDGAGHEKMYLVIDDTKLDSEEGYEGYAATAVWGTIREKPTNLIFCGESGSSTEVPTSADFITRGQIIDHLTSTDATLPLSARQGGILKSSLDEMQTEVDGIQEAVGGLNKDFVTHKSSGDHDGRYYTEEEVNNLLSGKSNTSHNHDSRYYTESEISNLLKNKQDKIVTQIYTTNTVSDYVIVAKTGYILLAAYNIRGDSSHYVKGIQKQSADYTYTILIEGVNNVSVALYLIWAKEQ